LIVISVQNDRKRAIQSRWLWGLLQKRLTRHEYTFGFSFSD
jgi:hypothetical protein